jgi:Glycosyltransferase family 87
LWIATPTMLTLQVGNFQLATIALTLIAFTLFWRDRPILGGALFGFAVFKLFPGLLGIYLIATKRWRALFWTLGFSSLYTVIAFLWLGENPFRALFEFHLPRLASGEAWAFLEIPQLAPVVAINDSVPGIVLKLKALGVPGMDMALSKHVGWVWTLIIAALTVLAARRAPKMSRHELAMTWTALLALAAFRSPFLPDHTGLFAPLWLWTLVAAGGALSGRRLLKFALLWAQNWMMVWTASSSPASAKSQRFPSACGQCCVGRLGCKKPMMTVRLLLQ